MEIFAPSMFIFSIEFLEDLTTDLPNGRQVISDFYSVVIRVTCPSSGGSVVKKDEPQTYLPVGRFAQIFILWQKLLTTDMHRPT
jgi:hypothetical protein